MVQFIILPLAANDLICKQLQNVILYVELRKPMSNTLHVAISDMQICSLRINLLVHVKK